MGVVVATGPCYGCGDVFMFDPELVPSLVVDAVRRPICRRCVAKANPQREKRGLPRIVPLPGAYGPEP